MIRVLTDKPHSASLMVGGGTVGTKRAVESTNGKLVTGSMELTSSPFLVSLMVKTDLSGAVVVTIVGVVVIIRRVGGEGGGAGEVVVVLRRIAGAT